MNFDRIIAVRNDKTVYRDSDRCLKVFNDGYSKADVLNEALNQARLEETPLNVPKVLEVTVTDGKWTLVSEYIKGKTLAQMMKDEPERKDEFISTLVVLQIETQHTVCPGLVSLKEKMSRSICQTDLVATMRYDLHMRLEAMHRDNKVCHCDFEPSNIIIRDDGTPYIIDWSHAAQGDPLADAARTYLRLYLEGDIGGAERYMEIYCEKSGAQKEQIEKWIPLVAAAQSIRGNAAERDTLHKWIDC